MLKSHFNQSEQFEQMKPYKAKYTKTSMKKKKILIDMVVFQKFSIYRASKKLKISNSTAKSIITNYNKNGTILERNTKPSIQKINSSKLKDSDKEARQETLREEAFVKQQEHDWPIVMFSQEERKRIIQKMGISVESYPFFETPLPYFFQIFKT